MTTDCKNCVNYSNLVGIEICGGTIKIDIELPLEPIVQDGYIHTSTILDGKELPVVINADALKNTPDVIDADGKIKAGEKIELYWHPELVGNSFLFKDGLAQLYPNGAFYYPGNPRCEYVRGSCLYYEKNPLPQHAT